MSWKERSRWSKTTARACSGRETPQDFKANSRVGHHLVNKSIRDAVYLEVGTRSKYERAHYPDLDLMVVRDDKGMRYTHKNGEPYT